MRHSIYAKFILSYILFGLMCILFMNMWSTKRVKEQITYDAAATLYNTGTLILNNYIPADLTAFDEENTSPLDEAAMLNNNMFMNNLNSINREEGNQINSLSNINGMTNKIMRQNFSNQNTYNLGLTALGVIPISSNSFIICGGYDGKEYKPTFKVFVDDATEAVFEESGYGQANHADDSFEM